MNYGRYKLHNAVFFYIEVNEEPLTDLVLDVSDRWAYELYITALTQTSPWGWIGLQENKNERKNSR